MFSLIVLFKYTRCPKKPHRAITDSWGQHKSIEPDLPSTYQNVSFEVKSLQSLLKNSDFPKTLRNTSSYWNRIWYNKYSHARSINHDIFGVYLLM